MLQAPIFTAVEFYPDAEDDVRSMVTQPLLHDELPFGSEDEKEPERNSNKISAAGYIFLGVATGFLIQVISLGAYAFMLAQFGHESKEMDSGWFVYSILSLLTQVDLFIYVLIWAAFTCTMTRNGMALIRLQYQAPVKRRSVFVIGVYFLVGIVLGAFFAWTMIDVYLGFPIPFVPIAATVSIDLILCYMMVFCYDLGREEDVDDEEIAGYC